MSFRTIDYRNCRYQGFSQKLDPSEEGILLDDCLRFAVGTWLDNQLHGNVVVFDSHEKYIYGTWSNGVPEGLNVYRGGETLLLANFSAGKIVGKFIVLFETQGLMFTVQMEREEAVILKKSSDIKKQDVQLAGREIVGNQNISEVLSLLNFVHRCYGTSEHPSGISFSKLDDMYFLGINNGLGIIFSDDNFIHRVGQLSNQKQVTEIGGMYTANGAKEGDFESGDVITYKDERPVKELKQITHNYFLKSVTFKNSYLLTDFNGLFNSISDLLKKHVVSKIAQSTLHDSRRFNVEDFNDSLEYHVKEDQENNRLKKMRAQLYLSIGRPGSEIKPVSPLMINEFIEIEEKEKMGKHSISGKYSHMSKKGYYDNDESKELTARFEMVDYRRQSSPLQYERKKSSMRLTNPSAKSLYTEAPGWMEESKRIIENQKSKSPLKKTSIYIPSKPDEPIIVSPKASVTFGNKTQSIHPSIIPSIHASSSIQSSNPINSSSVKYEDLKEKRARILKQYKNIGNNRSSPPRLSPSKPQYSESPYTGLQAQASLKQSRRDSTDIKTISRRLDKIELNSRSPQRYSYLNSFI